MRAEWLHVDINSYFASLLQQENPALRNRPVGVLKAAGRTCVITSSKEAKKLGVRTGYSRQEAERLAPGIIFVPAPFDMCLAATRRLNTLFADLVPEYEIFSLDEALLSVGSCQRLYPDLHVLAKEIQDRVRAELGEWVTCNVGIGPNRFLAKMAGEIAPKGSVLEINDTNKDEILASTTFESVCGIGFRLGARLARFGITTPYQIRLLPQEALEKEFGPFWSVELMKMAWGEEPAFLEHSAERDEQPMKSVSRSITGYRLCNDEDTIKRVLYNLTEEVGYKARRMKMSGRYVALGVSGDGQGWSDHLTLQSYVRHTSELFSLLYDRLYCSWRRSFPVIRYWVNLGMLRSDELLPEPWLLDWQKQKKITQALDSVNGKYGLFTVRSGILTQGHIIRPEVTGYLGDKQYQLQI